ncbi:putative cysteine desulfurase [Nymphaea thermarum]|nr:putative cysteine desulfurase [Nymphaea thermarum]
MSVLAENPQDLPDHGGDGHFHDRPRAAGFNPFGSPPNDSNPDDWEEKCRWLRSQVIGCDTEFGTPFGRRLITYVDFTASGRFMRCVEDYLNREVLPYYGNTHTEDSHVGLVTSKKVHEATSFVKKCLGGGPHDALIFCGTGATAAIKRLQEVIGIAVPSILRKSVLSQVPESERWVVFMGPYEHHSNLLSWRESLAEVVEIGLSEAGLVDVEALQSALENPKYAGRPMLGTFSACSNITGVLTDTKAIARLLHEHGAFACFDFASSGPYVEIDMKSGEADGYDAIFLSPHKFVGGPGGPGILLISDALYRLKGVAPSTSGGGTDTLYCEDVEEREDAGTPGIVQKIRAALAFAVKEYMGHALIYHKENALATMSVARLLSNPRVKVLGNPGLQHQPVISFLIYPLEAPERGGKHLHCRLVTRLLNDLFGVQARGGCACAGPYGHCLLGIGSGLSKAIRAVIEMGYDGIKPGWTRVSFCYYSPNEEMAFVTDAIEFVAAYGYRFLHLYEFDWMTGNWNFMKSGFRYKKVMKLLEKTQSSRTCLNCPGNDTNSKYQQYLETARSIAAELPDFPTSRAIPEILDPQLVTFMT